MRVGSIVLSTEQGRGILARGMYDHGIIDEVLLKQHSFRKNHPEWFNNAEYIGNPQEDFVQTQDPSTRERVIITNFLSKIDILFILEIPFYFKWWQLAHGGEKVPIGYDLLVDAQRMGVKVVLMPMYECSPVPLDADLYLCPSALDKQVYEKIYPGKKIHQITVPVNVPWKQRTMAKEFIFNAGNGGTNDRNGIPEVVEALKYIKSPFTLTIRSQNPLPFTIEDSRVKLEIGTFPYEELYADGDVFLFPEKFNGLSLPLQEAHASGMLVMASNRFPNTEWLPEEPLIPVAGYEEDRITNVPFSRAIIKPADIAQTVDNWYGKDITRYSLAGKEWGENHSWKNMKPKYLKIFKQILRG